MAWELLSEVNLENLTVTCSYSQLIQDWLQSPNYLQRANYEWQSVGGNISFSDSILMFRPNSGSDYQTINFDSHFKCIWDSSGITFKLDETTVFYTSQGFNFYNSDYNHNAICIMVDHELQIARIAVIFDTYHQGSLPSQRYSIIWVNGQYDDDSGVLYSYLTTPPITYNWQSVPSISGKNGILSLVTLDSESINDGEPVSGAAVSVFDQAPSSDNNIKNLADTYGGGEESSAVDVTVKYKVTLPPGGSFSTLKIVAKKDSIPEDASDGDKIVDISPSKTKKTVTGLDENSLYYFKIFGEDTNSNTSESDEKHITTSGDEGWLFDYTGEIQTFVAPKTGIYLLETWGAQGGDATDGTNSARGGYGAYAVGEVLLQQGDTIYINVGGQNGYGGGGSNLPIHNLETWNYRGNVVSMSILSDFTKIPDAVKTATSYTSSRIYDQSASSRPSWLTIGDVLYTFTQNTGETDEYIFVDSPYIKIQFGKYQENGSTYYGFAVFNKITDSKIDSYGDSLSTNTTRKYYLSIIIDTPNQRAYMLVSNSKSDMNYFRVDAKAFMYNGIDLLWETFSNY